MVKPGGFKYTSGGFKYILSGFRSTVKAYFGEETKLEIEL